MQLLKISTDIIKGLLLTLVLSPVLAAETPLSATEIMTRVDERYDGDSAISNSTMTLIDRRERQRVRQIRSFRKEYGDHSRSVSFFETPVEIRGTAFLSYDWDDVSTEDDSWLYLPALQQVRRIASSDKSDSFLGSDFSYADIEGLEISWYDYRFVSESEAVDGVDCWVIEITPKEEFRAIAEQTTGYSRSQTWIRKDNFIPVQGIIWVLDGERIKYYSAGDIEEIDGIWTANRIQMVTTKQGVREHSSVIVTNSISYNEPLEDALFDTSNMQRNF